MALIQIRLNEPVVGVPRRLGPAPKGLDYGVTLVEQLPLHLSILRQIRVRLQVWAQEPDTDSAPPLERLPVSELKSWISDIPRSWRAVTEKPATPAVSSQPVVFPPHWGDYFRQKSQSRLNASSGDEFAPNVFPGMVSDAERWRRKATFFFSVTAHALVVLILMIVPKLFPNSGRQMMAFQAVPEPPRNEQFFLWLPPHLVPPPPPPNTSILSDRDRRAQGRAPEITPEAPPLPYSRGESDLPEVAGGEGMVLPPSPPPVQGGSPEKGDAEEDRDGIEQQEAELQENRENNQQIASLRLKDIQGPGNGTQGELEFSIASPGESIQKSMRNLGKENVTGPGGPGASESQFNNPFSTFSMDAPTILSDTRGVNFGPYLSRLLFSVRRNWYMVIPEVARLGKKGRVAFVFDILRDGNVREINMVFSSGTFPLDNAALASIKMSIPAPPLPEEFTGPFLRLQFTFLYNQRVGR